MIFFCFGFLHDSNGQKCRSTNIRKKRDLVDGSYPENALEPADMQAICIHRLNTTSGIEKERPVVVQWIIHATLTVSCVGVNARKDQGWIKGHGQTSRSRLQLTTHLLPYSWRSQL